MANLDLAHLNIGRLLVLTHDPRMTEIMGTIDRMNGLGKRMPGFEWLMEGSGVAGTGSTEAEREGDAQFVSNLTIWPECTGQTIDEPRDHIEALRRRVSELETEI